MQLGNRSSADRSSECSYNPSMKVISIEAYQALRDVLSAVTWYKRDFESLIRTAMRRNPELLAGLNFSETKRSVADQLVNRLAELEHRYHDATLDLMLELAEMKQFPDLERLQEPDRAKRLEEARLAVQTLSDTTAKLADQRAERDRLAGELEARRAQAKKLRRFEGEFGGLKGRFLTLQSANDPHRRGYDFEALLSELFKIFDMEPRLASRTESEQIDGSLSFDTDDYILEAKWLADKVDRAAADAFAAKVRRKGKNALGLFVSVSGFSAPALRVYAEATPFIAMDGDDLFMVLDGRVRLDDLLRAKRRNANETGSCYLSARLISQNC